MRGLVPAIVVTAAVAAAAGCGGGSSGSSGSYGAPPPSTTTPASASSTSGALSGSVGPGFDISMDTTSVPAGTYTLTIDDQADTHNFHLKGPGEPDPQFGLVACCGLGEPEHRAQSEED